MKRINYSNFELLQDLIKEADFNYNPEICQNIEDLKKIWTESIGKKISNFSKVYDFSADNILTISCSDSFTANELFFEKENLLKYINKEAQKIGITIKDIRFDYKKWKENNNE